MGFQKKQRFSIRKSSVGAVSVLIALVLSAYTVQADSTQTSLPDENNKIELSSQNPAVSAAEEMTDESSQNISEEDSSSAVAKQGENKQEEAVSSSADLQVPDQTETAIPSSQDTDTAAVPQAADLSVKEEGGKLQEQDRVVALVSLKEDPVDPQILQSAESIQERAISTEVLRQQVLQELDAKGLTYRKLYDYDLLFNGFALETNYATAKAIQDLKEVERVEISIQSKTADSQSKGAAPEKNTSQQVIESNQLINIQPLWDNGIKGQGQLVAVIDTGLDAVSDVMRISDLQTARFKSAEEIEAAKQQVGISYGKWINDKVVFAFNYNDWNDEIKESEIYSHGMHVSSTAVGNPSEPSPNGEYVTGVAPEAQLLFMRVFSDYHSGTQAYIYMKALEDAIKLGADTVNMSLGAESTLTNEIGEISLKAIEFARAAGVSISAAVGNSNAFGYGYEKPSTENPDYGLVGRPSVARDVIAVGAMNNTVDNVEIVTIPQLSASDKLTDEERKIFAFENVIFPTDQEYSYVAVENGAEADFADKDLTGKIALVLRDSVQPAQIVKAAKKAGALGVMLVNDVGRGEIVKSESVSNEELDYPVSFIGYKAGQELAQHADEYTLKFEGKRIKIPYEKAGEILEYSSWGLTGDGYIKPDLIAPGGKVFAAINDGRYYTDSGTSMAAPHVTGAVTLIRQVLKERFADISSSALQALVKHLAMSQADPHIDAETGVYTSPRLQGAGILNAANAAYGDVYVTGLDDYGSLSLGNVADQFQLAVTLHNISEEEKEITYSYVLNTDETSNGHVTLHPRLLQDIQADQIIVVPAKGQVTVSIAVDASSFSKELQEAFANGYYLEGFVFFKDAATGQKLASIPYVGFRGEFQNLAAFEKPIYDFTADEKPFYYYSKNSLQKDPENNFTALVGTVLQDKESTEYILGESYQWESNSFIYDKTKLAFSPNGDQNLDDISLKVTALRNYDNLHLAIYAENDTYREHPIYQTGNDHGKKTYYDDGLNEKSEILSVTLWDGLDQDGNPVADGNYQYVVTYRPSATGAKLQEISFNVIVDTKAPETVGIGGTYDENSRTFTLFEITETGSGILSTVLSYTKNGQTQYILADSEGRFVIPEGLALSDLELLITDRAANTKRLNLAGQVQKEESNTSERDTAVSDGNAQNYDETDSAAAEATQGTLEVQFIVDGKLKPKYNSSGRYVVTDENGQRITGEFVKNGNSLSSLPFGRYKVELVLTGENLTLTTSNIAEVELTKEQPQAVVAFNLEKQTFNKFDVIFDQAAPAGTKITATNEAGQSFDLFRSLFDQVTFERSLGNGSYQINVELPEDYQADQVSFTYEVGDKVNNQLLKLFVPHYVSQLSSSEDSVLTGKMDFGEQQVTDQTVFSMTYAEASDLVEKITKELTTPYSNLTVYQLRLQKNGQDIDLDGKKVLSLTGLTGKSFKVYLQTADGLTELASKFENGQLSFETETLGLLVIVTDKEVSKQERKQLRQAIKEGQFLLHQPAYIYSSRNKQAAFQAVLWLARLAWTDSDIPYEAYSKVLELLLSANRDFSTQSPAQKLGKKTALRLPSLYFTKTVKILLSFPL